MSLWNKQEQKIATPAKAYCSDSGTTRGLAEYNWLCLFSALYWEILTFLFIHSQTVPGNANVQGEKLESLSKMEFVFTL